MYRYLVLYRKNNGEIIYRARTTIPQHKTGEVTSMGWTVVDIRRLHKGRTYSNDEFDMILNRRATVTQVMQKITNLYLIDIFKFILIGMAIVYFITKLEN